MCNICSYDSIFCYMLWAHCTTNYHSVQLKAFTDWYHCCCEWEVYRRISPFRVSECKFERGISP